MGQRCGGNSIVIVWIHSASCTRLLSCAMGYVVATVLLLHAYLCCDSACLCVAARMLHVCILIQDEKVGIRERGYERKQVLFRNVSR